MKQHFISILDINSDELHSLIVKAHELKKNRNKGIYPNLLSNKSLGMIFEKSSTRTRISFEVGMHELGGHAMFLNPKDMQLGRGEDVKDTARVLSRFVSAVLIRANYHETLLEFSKYASLPVINGLSDYEHPCQILADIMTITEHFPTTKGLKVAWIGDGNNVCNSHILASHMTGMEICVATPDGYQPPKEVVERSLKAGGKISLFRDPIEAVKSAQVVMTDTWVSMGAEAESKKRENDFKGYSVTNELLTHASPDAIVMHCLPAHRGEEISSEVMDGPQSVVWDEAENRLHAQKALLLMLLS